VIWYFALLPLYRPAIEGLCEFEQKIFNLMVLEVVVVVGRPYCVAVEKLR
jgi:hypothetical protein